MWKTISISWFTGDNLPENRCYAEIEERKDKYPDKKEEPISMQAVRIKIQTETVFQTVKMHVLQLQVSANSMVVLIQTGTE